MAKKGKKAGGAAATQTPPPPQRRRFMRPELVGLTKFIVAYRVGEGWLETVDKVFDDLEAAAEEAMGQLAEDSAADPKIIQVLIDPANPAIITEQIAQELALRGFTEKDLQALRQDEADDPAASAYAEGFNECLDGVLEYLRDFRPKTVADLAGFERD